MRFVSLCIATAGFLAVPIEILWAQVGDYQARQGVERLQQEDLSLRSQIQGARIDRQAEIGRLEGRIAKLERMARSSSPRMETSQFIQLLLFLEQARRLEAIPSESSESAKSAQDEQQAEEPTEPESAAVSSSEQVPELRQESLMQAIAQDYMAGLRAEMLEAQIEVVEHSRQLLSLQRLAGKGLASKPQLELEGLKKQSAEVQFRRLEKQRESLRRLFPDYFSDELPAPGSQEQDRKDNETSS